MQPGLPLLLQRGHPRAAPASPAPGCGAGAWDFQCLLPSAAGVEPSPGLCVLQEDEGESLCSTRWVAGGLHKGNRSSICISALALSLFLDCGGLGPGGRCSAHRVLSCAGGRSPVRSARQRLGRSHQAGELCSRHVGVSVRGDACVCAKGCSLLPQCLWQRPPQHPWSHMSFFNRRFHFWENKWTNSHSRLTQQPAAIFQGLP